MLDRSLVIGKQFEKLTVLDRSVEHTGRARVWVRCECGTEKTIQLRHLLSGAVKSCGCHRREMMISRERGTVAPPPPVVGSIWIDCGKGVFTLVDDFMFDKLKDRTWLINQSGYVAARIRGKNVLMHRIILPVTGEVDHKNGNKLDNRLENLRPATHTENMQNRKAYSGRKWKGAHWCQGRWQASISVNKTLVYLGVFDTPEEAAHAYDNAAKKHFGVFARLNFPDD